MEKVKGYCFALFSAVLLGLMAVLVKEVMAGGLSLLGVIFFRFALSSLLLAGFLLVKRVNTRINKKQFWLLLFVAVVGYGVMNLCYYGAFLLISVGMTSMIHYIYPGIALILAKFLFHKEISRRTYVALIVAVIGAMTISFAGVGPVRWLGVALAVLAGVCYGIYAAFMDHPALRELCGTVVVFYLTSFTAVFALILSLFRPGYFWAGLTLENGLVMAFIALFCTVAAMFLFREAVVRVGTVHTTILSTMEPLSAAVLGIVFLNESLDGWLILGSVLVIIAVILTVDPGFPRAAAKTAALAETTESAESAESAEPRNTEMRNILE